MKASRRKFRFFTEDEKRAMCALRDEGLSVKEIADRFARHPAQVTAITAPSNSRDERVRRMRLEGYTMKVIAETFGISTARVSMIAGGLIPKNQNHRCHRPLEQDLAILAARMRGDSFTSIASQFGLSKSGAIAVCRRMSRQKLPETQGHDGE